MEYRKFPQGYALRLDPGEEVVECLTRLVDREHVRLGTVSALGAANDVTIGIYDTAEKKYYSKRYQGQFEISALVGNVTRQEGIYTVEAPWLERIMLSVDFDDSESLQYFQRVLIQTGVIDALREAGCDEGDTVDIYGLEFDFVE